MKKSFIILLFALSISATFSACKNSTIKNAPVEVKKAEVESYTCTMHPEVQTEKPGDCPKCGMTLVKGQMADTTKMHDHSAPGHKH